MPSHTVKTRYLAVLLISTPLIALFRFIVSARVHLLYTAPIVLVKSSLLMLYLRLFPTLSWTIIGTITLVVAMGVSFTLAASFRCNPVGAAWNPWKYELNSFTCFLALPFWNTFGALFLVSDIVVLVLPMKLILGRSLRRAYGSESIYSCVGMHYRIRPLYRSLIYYRLQRLFLKSHGELIAKLSKFDGSCAMLRPISWFLA